MNTVQELRPKALEAALEMHYGPRWLEARKAADAGVLRGQMAAAITAYLAACDEQAEVVGPPTIETRNDLAGFTEYLNEDVPTVVRDIHAGVAILLHLDTRRVVGYRVYDINEGWSRSSEDVLPKLANCGHYLAEDNTGQWHYINHANTWQAYPGPPAVAAGGVTEEQREAVKMAIRTALTDRMTDSANAHSWDADMLLAGCTHYLGLGYEKPAEAADKLASDAADAAITILTAARIREGDHDNR